jgi:hypothetical protein
MVAPMASAIGRRRITISRARARRDGFAGEERGLWEFIFLQKRNHGIRGSHGITTTV